LKKIGLNVQGTPGNGPSENQKGNTSADKRQLLRNGGSYYRKGGKVSLLR
jgi:hypothetical protein